MAFTAVWKRGIIDAENTASIMERRRRYDINDTERNPWNSGDSGDPGRRKEAAETDTESAEETERMPVVYNRKTINRRGPRAGAFLFAQDLQLLLWRKL